MPLDVFMLYRPTAPSLRAQTIQVLHSAVALAQRGHRVEVWVEPARGAVFVEEVLRPYGLERPETLKLGVLSPRRSWASVQFRRAFADWMRRSGGQGVAIARSKRYAREGLRWFRGRFRLVLEAHEVDSVQARDAGFDGDKTEALEREVLAGAVGVLCNCEGTRDLLLATHPGAPATRVVHNATAPNRIRSPQGPGVGFGYLGSASFPKGLHTLAAAAALCEPGLLHLVGPVPEEMAQRLKQLSSGNLVIEPAVPFARVPDRLAAFQGLVLSVGDDRFGQQLTSPLKAFDYLAASRPIVAADTPAIRAVLGERFLGYAPGDPMSLAAAVQRLQSDSALAERLAGPHAVRTWDDRAREVEAFLYELGLGERRG